MIRSPFAAVSALAWFAFMLTAAGARAEVVSSTPDGFVLRYETAAEVPAEDVYQAIGQIGQWWDGAHTYSGDAHNLSLPLQVGGCMCEAMPDGSTFEHGHIVQIDPETGVLLDAPLGPMKGKTTKAQWSIGWTGANHGLTIVMIYVVEGQGLGAIASGVDGVMQGQFNRLVHYVEYGEP